MGASCIYRLVVGDHAVAVIRPENWRCVRRLANQLAAALELAVRIELGGVVLGTVLPPHRLFKPTDMP